MSKRKKEKEKEKKSVKNSNVDEAHVQLHMGIFIQKWCPISSFNFISILRKKLFGRLGEETPRPHHLLSFIPTQLFTLKKVFLPIFSPKFFIYPISPPNKHTLSDGWKMLIWLIIKIKYFFYSTQSTMSV